MVGELLGPNLSSVASTESLGIQTALEAWDWGIGSKGEVGKSGCLKVW